MTGWQTAGAALIVLGILALLGLLAVDRIVTGGQVMSVIYVLLGGGTGGVTTALVFRAQTQQRLAERADRPVPTPTP